MKFAITVLIIALSAFNATAETQSIYRTVTNQGRVVYSDDVANPPGNNVRDTRTYTVDSGNNGNQPPNACQADGKKFCAGRGGSTTDCLLDHQQEISDACYDGLKKQLSAAPAKPSAPPENEGRQACRNDAQRFCREIEPGGGRIVKCLLNHQNDLSDGCYSALERQMSQRR